MRKDAGRAAPQIPPEEPLWVGLPSGVRHPTPTRAAAFLGLIKQGEALQRALDSELQAAHGLSLRAYEVLLHLAAFSSGGRLRISALADQAPLSQSRVSRLVAELEARGLVTKGTARGDSRGVEVALTDKGLAKLVEAQDTHHAGLEEHFFSKLDWEEIALLARISSRLQDEKPAHQ